MTKLSFISPSFSDAIKSNPTLLYYQGQFVHRQMKKERILQTEILQAIRSAGHNSLDDIQAVILETDGTLSIISHSTDSNIKDSQLFAKVQE